MPFISTNTWVLKIIDGTLSHRMKALGGYALYDEAFAGAREDAFDPATERAPGQGMLLQKHDHRGRTVRSHERQQHVRGGV